jgi:hypothetical protein
MRCQLPNTAYLINPGMYIRRNTRFLRGNYLILPLCFLLFIKHKMIPVYKM